MSKINILVIPSDIYGIGAFRFMEPHINIQKQFDNDFHVDIVQQSDFNINDITKLKNYNIIFGHKDMCSLEQAKQIFPVLQESGIKIIMDIDDSWDLPQGHPYYIYAKQEGYGKRIMEMLSLADYVTTTTEFFKKEILKSNKNVVVFPNAVDPTAKKYQIKEVSSEKIRLGYLAGSSHLEDLKMLTSMFNSVNERYKDKIQTVLCGFDTRGNMIERDQNGQERSRPIQPKETCWYDYEKIVTSNYKNIPKDYFEFLMKFKKEDYNNVENLPYNRVWTKPVSTYSLNYNLMDISFAPLVINKFNMCKSQLKVVEAGFFKKALIASEIEPYLIDIKHGVNGFLVKNNSQTKDWAYYTKKLIDNPELAKEMGENLYNTVKDKYDIRNVSKSRADWYKEILK